jgi:hypothetical protein
LRRRSHAPASPPLRAPRPRSSCRRPCVPRELAPPGAARRPPRGVCAKRFRLPDAFEPSRRCSPRAARLSPPAPPPRCRAAARARAPPHPGYGAEKKRWLEATSPAPSCAWLPADVRDDIGCVSIAPSLLGPLPAVGARAGPYLAPPQPRRARATDGRACHARGDARRRKSEAPRHSAVLVTRHDSAQRWQQRCSAARRSATTV